MSIFNLFLAGIVAIALAVVGFVWAFQNYGIYTFPVASLDKPIVVSEGVEAVQFRSGDGTMIGARVIQPAPGRPLIFSFYGNGADVDESLLRLSGLTAKGYGIAMMEYRGAGATPGKSSEESFARDALAFYDAMDGLIGKEFPASERVLHGFSLGSGVGSRLAVSRPFAAVVFEAAPYRTCLYYQDRYKGFPFCSLMWAERYDIVDYVKQIEAPKLFIHGKLDEALPVERARRLFEEAPQPKEYLEVAEGHHADLDRFGLAEAIDNFLSRNVDP
ncbi:MAG: hypothetical protein KF874_04335 [Rhizobiaceae bacterium]|nr:hypothetical protein [Rhizobiaceae bacterium]